MPLAEEGSVRSTSWSFAAASLGGTYLRLPRLLQWFTGNIGFHHVHHVDPRIPQLVSLKVLV
jgi:acyl-lipid omega-6 desaturase (Delta-12 desaturase)